MMEYLFDKSFHHKRWNRDKTRLNATFLMSCLNIRPTPPTPFAQWQGRYGKALNPPCTGQGRWRGRWPHSHRGVDGHGGGGGVVALAPATIAEHALPIADASR
jgi:hypothetical protein